VDDALVNLNRERRILLTVNQFFTAGKVVAASNLLMVIPRHLIDATGMSSQLIQRALPLKLPEVHIDMLWHERDARSPGHRWLREQLRNSGVLARSDNKDTSS
jgi:DNA-binding transcriptional LysR family regulator